MGALTPAMYIYRTGLAGMVRQRLLRRLRQRSRQARAPHFLLQARRTHDPGSVIIGLSVGASIACLMTFPQTTETVKITGISGLNVTVASVANSHASGCQVLITSDSTNYCQFHDVKLIFPFWHALVSDNIEPNHRRIMIHMLPREHDEQVQP